METGRNFLFQKEQCTVHVISRSVFQTKPLIKIPRANHGDKRKCYKNYTINTDKKVF